MRRRTRTGLIIGASVAAAVLVLVIAGVLVLTQTDWGRARVRGIALEQLRNRVAGQVEIARVEGNLLQGARLIDVAIADSAGQPFLRADTLSFRYTLRSYFTRQLVFRDVVLVNPYVRLDDPPGADWNFKRLFPTDTTMVDTVAGFGSWLRLEDVTVRNGTFLVRSEWAPPDSLRGDARDAAVAAALSPRSRLRIEPVPGGYQSVMEFERVNAELPLLRLADPDSADRIIRFGRLAMAARPFRPPPVPVHDLAGTVILTDERALFRDLRLTLPGTRARLDGWYALGGTGAYELRVNAPEIALADLRFVEPELPEGSGQVTGTVSSGGTATRLVAQRLELSAEGARVDGSADVLFGDTVRFGPTDVAFSGLDTELARRFTDVLPAALHGQANGRLRLQGTTDELDVDGWAAFRERGGATSRVAADGRLRNLDGTVQARAVTLHFDPLQLSLARRFAPDLAMAGRITGRATLTGSTRSGFDLNADLSHVGAPAGRSRVLADGRLLLDEGPVARDLRLRFDPLQVALARTLVASLPLDGTLTGRATLNGRLAERVRADLDVRHHAATGPSHLVGRADVTFGTPTRFDVAVRAPELSLATLGRFAPAAQLRGSASGRIALQGTSARFAVDTRLAVARGGQVDLRGTFAPQRGVPRYDFSTRFANFDAAAVSGRAPPTVLEGVVVATGQGFDPATMNATVRADLVDVQLGDGSVAADSTRLLVRLEDGLATAERAHIQLASVRADLEGSFGLVAGRTGELRFDVHIDSAGQFRGYLPGADTGLVPPRPRLQQRAIATARQDSLRIARATEVERAATGQPPLPPLRYDTIPPVPRDSLAGSLRATGVLVGNIEAFDARGEAMAERLVFGGNSLARGRADFVLTGASTPNPRLELNAAADSLRAGGFAFDSARIRADYAGTPGRGQGSAEIDIHQEPDHDYSLASRFRLSTERSELILERLAVNLDTVRWNATRPGVISWGGSGIELGHIELASTGGGRIFAEGRLPSEGEADVRLEVAQLQLGSLAPLLQDTMLLTGLLSLDARLRGTRAAPRIEGTTSLDSAHYAGTWLPDLRARFTYAGAELEARAEALRGARLLATAEGRLPIDLALQEVAGGRLLDGPLRAEIRADSLPLDALPSFTDQVTEIRGRVRGQASVAGTVRDPAVEGVAELDLGSLRLAATGVRMTEVNGVVRFDGETATLDSLVAQARGGSVRVSGTLGLAQLTRPSFDLAMTSDGAQLLNNEHGDIRADANLTLAGAFDAPRVEGTVRVTEGVVYVPDIGHRRATELDLPELAQVVDTAAISPALIPRASPFLENLSLDVGVRVARNTWARNTRANVEIYTTAEDPLHIRMERGTNSLRVTGSIAAERGEYTYSGRTFGLNSGTATFLGTGEINPLLQLNGQYAVQRPGREALVIQITVSGVLRQPTVTLSSNAQPPLSQSELLAYFAFGGSSSSLLDLNSSSVAGGGGLSGLSTLAQQQLAGVAVGAVMEDVVADLQQEGTRAGLDVFRIRPAAVPEEIGFESYFQNILRGTEVEAGKYLSSRVFVGVQGRTSQALPGVRAEYRTPSGFSLESTWEPRYIPREPTLEEVANADPARVFGLFLFWTRRF